MEAVQDFATLLMNLKNNTRSWANKGHTPNEMHTAFAKKPALNVPSKVLPFPAPAKSQKIGRNEPCPCGSGKKYKKCCVW